MLTGCRQGVCSRELNEIGDWALEKIVAACYWTVIMFMR